MSQYLNKSTLIILFGITFNILLCFNPCSPASSQEPDSSLNALLQNIQTKSLSIQAFSCKFKQTRHLSIFSKPVIFNGILTLSKPAKLRWEVLDPIPSVILLNETKGIRCSAHSKQFSFDLTSGPKMHLVYKQFFQWLSGSIDSLHKFYEVKQIADFKIALIPLDENFSDIIKLIEIQFEPVSLQPSQVIIRENQDDFTEIAFTDYNLSPNLTESVFTKCQNM